MLTDDDIVTQLRGSYAGSMAGVVPDPDLLSRVHHEHTRFVRRRRLLAPAGVAVLGLAGAAAFTAWPSVAPPTPDHLTTRPSATPATSGPMVRLFDYAFTLPEGFVVTSQKEVDLATEQPPQPVPGRVAFLQARVGERFLDMSVYRGPIAAAQAAVLPANPGSVRTRKVAGHSAKTYTYAAGGPGCRAASCAGEGMETRLLTSPQELVVVMSEGVDVPTLDAVLTSGLG